VLQALPSVSLRSSLTWDIVAKRYKYHVCGVRIPWPIYVQSKMLSHALGVVLVDQIQTMLLTQRSPFPMDYDWTCLFVHFKICNAVMNLFYIISGRLYYV